MALTSSRISFVALVLCAMAVAAAAAREVPPLTSGGRLLLQEPDGDARAASVSQPPPAAEPTPTLAAEPEVVAATAAPTEAVPAAAPAAAIAPEVAVAASVTPAMASGTNPRTCCTCTCVVPVRGPCKPLINQPVARPMSTPCPASTKKACQMTRGCVWCVSNFGVGTVGCYERAMAKFLPPLFYKCSLAAGVAGANPLPDGAVGCPVLPPIYKSEERCEPARITTSCEEVCTYKEGSATFYYTCKKH